jgi:hypothetical protein
MSDGPGRGDPGDDAVPGRGGFDLSHLQAVHRQLFDGVGPETQIGPVRSGESWDGWCCHHRRTRWRCERRWGDVSAA